MTLSKHFLKFFILFLFWQFCQSLNLFPDEKRKIEKKAYVSGKDENTHKKSIEKLIGGQ